MNALIQELGPHHHADSEAETTDVAIVGYGPVGATLANILGKRGVRVTIFDREPGIYHQPRAGHVDGEAMRVFQSVGLAKQVEDRAVINAGMRFEDSKGRLLLDWPRPQNIGPDGWFPSYRFHQPFLEETLRNGVTRFPNVDVKVRCDVFALDQSTEQVMVKYEDMRNGSIRRLQAKYVVGCDGARSTVRQFMESKVDDLKSHERWVVVDVVLNRPRTDLPAVTVQICDDIRPTTMIKMVGERRRWEFMLTPDDDPTKIVKEQEIWRLLARWITPEEAEIERAVVYTFHSVVVNGWRKDRMLLAGDACHQTPPFMGQGMCAGIRDVANLSWKLCLVLENPKADALLDTYERERSPHVRKYIDTAVSLGSIIQAGPRSNGHDANADLAQMPQRMQSLMVSLGPGLNKLHPLAGTIVPQINLSSSLKLDDMAGPRFALLLKASIGKGLSSLQKEQLDELDVLIVIDNEIDVLLDQLEVGLIVMRPDRYVYYAADDFDETFTILSEMCCHGLVKKNVDPGSEEID